MIFVLHRYTVAINGTSYSVDVPAGCDRGTVRDELVDLINAGSDAFAFPRGPASIGLVSDGGQPLEVEVTHPDKEAT